MRFFNIDLHISVIADIKKLFKELGHRVDDISLSGHHAIMGRNQEHVYAFEGKGKTIEERVVSGDWQEFFDKYQEDI